MSTTLREPASSRELIEEQMREVFDFHEKSCQALGDVSHPAHNDGERIHQDFGVEPFHKYVARCERHDKNVALYPSAWVTALVHLREREIELLEQLTGEVDYRHDEFHPSHEALEDYPPYRAKMLEWIADDDGDRLPWNADGNETIDCWIEGGSDMHIVGEPGAGKSTLFNSMAMWLMQLNNETVLWADSLASGGTNERTEWLPLAPYATIAIPAGIPVTVRIVPEDPTVETFEVGIEAICRDVIRYESVRDLNRQLLPGQFVVVYPDPLHRGCEDVSEFSYHPPSRVDSDDDNAPDNPTPANQWWFAWFASRISYADFNHWTSVFIDEAGNIFDPDASKGTHDTYDKLTWFAKKFADARKKGTSVFTATHALSEEHQAKRKKQRWWMTMNGTSPPIGKTLPGDKKCPMPDDYASNMDDGEGQAWTTTNYASVSWPNLKRDARLDAEISIDFDLAAIGEGVA